MNAFVNRVKAFIYYKKGPQGRRGQTNDARGAAGLAPEGVAASKW